MAEESKTCYISSDQNCDQIETCQSVHHILDALKFHERLQIDDKIKNDDDILEYFNEHASIVNDYHHIMIQHLSTGNKATDNRNFNTIDKILIYFEGI